MTEKKSLAHSAAEALTKSPLATLANIKLRHKKTSRLLRALLYLPLILLISCALLVSTQMGAQIVIALTNQYFNYSQQDNHLQLQYQSGTLNSTLSFAHISYKTSSISLKSDKVIVTWQPLCLLTKQLCIEDFSAKTLAISLKNQPHIESQAITTQRTTISLPIELLLANANLGDFKLELDKQTFHATEVALKANWLQESLNLKQVFAETLDIKVIKNIADSETRIEPEISKAPVQALPLLPEIFSPISINIESAKLAKLNLEINQYNEQLSELSLSGSFKGSRLQLTTLSAQDRYFDTQANGHIELSKSYPVSMSLTLRPKLVAQQDQSQQAAKKLPHTTELSDSLLTEVSRTAYWQTFVADTLTLKLSQDMTQLGLSATLAGSNTLSLKGNLELLSPQLAYNAVIHDANIDLSATGLNAKLDLSTANLSGDINQQSIQAKGQLSSVYNRAISIKHNDTSASSSADIDANGRINLQALTQPAPNKASINNSGQSKSRSKNEPSPLNFSIDGTHFSTQQFIFKKANINYQKSRLSLTGKIDYKNKLTWQSAVELTELNAADLNSLLIESQLTQDQHSPIVLSHFAQQAFNSLEFTQSPKVDDLPSNNSTTDKKTIPKVTPLIGTLAGEIQTSGHYDPVSSQWQANLDKLDLLGKIQGLPLSVNGNISINNHYQAKSTGLTAEALGAKLNISGTTQSQWQLNAKLSIPDLTLWHPQLEGQVSASMDMGGNQQDPQLVLAAQANQLSYLNNGQHHSIDSLQAKGYYQPTAEHSFAVSVKSKALSFILSDYQSTQPIQLDSTTIAIKGDRHNQKMGIHSFGDIRLDSAIYGKLSDNGTWQGNITRFTVASQLGLWQLNHPVNIEWQPTPTTLSISSFCFIHDLDNLCLDKAQISQAPNGLDSSIALSANTDIEALLSPWLPQNVNWQGKLQFNTELDWLAQKKPTGTVSLTLSPGLISVSRDQQNSLEFDYQSIVAKGCLDSKQLAIQMQLDSSHIKSWKSQLSIDVAPERAIKGSVDIQGFNLNILAAFLPQTDVVKGILSSKLNIGGSLTKPRVTGDLVLNNGLISSSTNPTMIENLELHAKILGQSADIDAQWLMGSGQAQLSGKLNWPNGIPQAKLALLGNKLTIYQPPAAILAVSPSINLSITPAMTDIRGDIIVDEGEITLIQLTDEATPLSQDVVFEDSYPSQSTTSKSVQVSSKLNIRIKDQVKVTGMGLNAKLEGELSLEQQINRPALLFGDIKLINGQYRFFGQSLEINKGEFRFVGPIAQPNLYIEASREIKQEDVMAGVRVTGTPAKPIITLFSSPSKDQAEILSYIIKGKGLNSQSEDSNSFMLGAALSLSNQFGIGAISSITDRTTQLIERFGINQIQLETNDEGRVGISGYIGDDLMVKYAIGVFNPGYEMTVRYFLLSQLYIESVSGTLGQSLDIYYSFDL